MMFKKKDIDLMADHYKEEQEKKDQVPPYVEGPLTLTISIFVFGTALLILKGSIFWSIT